MRVAVVSSMSMMPRALDAPMTQQCQESVLLLTVRLDHAHVPARNGDLRVVTTETRGL